MVTFGSWIQKLRKDSGIDLRTIGQISGIHFTSIGRIEKGQNDPTLESAVKITTALKGNPSELCQLITGTTPPSPYILDNNSHMFPTIEDVLLFEKLIIEKPKSTGEYFAHLLNKVVDLFSPNEEIYRKDLPNPFQNKEVEWLNESLLKPTFSAIDVQKFLLHPSRSNISFILTPKCNYPEQFDPGIIIKIYMNNGVLIAEDLVRYTINEFENSEFTSFTDDKKIIHKFIKIQQIISKIEEQNQFSGIKLSDIVLVNNKFSNQGEIFMMAWNAASEEIRVKVQLNASNAARLLIIMSRYLSTLNNPEPDWLNRLHNL